MFSGQKTDFPAVNGADVKPEAAKPLPSERRLAERNSRGSGAGCVAAAPEHADDERSTSERFRQEPNIRPALRADAQAEIFSAAIRPSCACAAATRLRFPARELTKFAPRAAVY